MCVGSTFVLCRAAGSNPCASILADCACVPGNLVMQQQLKHSCPVVVTVPAYCTCLCTITCVLHATQSSASSPLSAAWKQLLPSCLSPQPDSGCCTYSSSAAADGSGSGSAVQLAAVDGHGAASSIPGSPGADAQAGLAGGVSSPCAVSLPKHQQQHSGGVSSQQPAAAWYPTDAQQQQQHLQSHGSQQQPQQQSQEHELHAVGPWVSSSSTRVDKQGTAATGMWRILWQSGGLQQHLTFEATQETREALHRHTHRWLHGPSNSGDEYNGTAAGEPQAEVLAAVAAAAAAAAAGSENGALEIAMPRHLTPGAFVPRLSEPSIIISAPGGSGTAGLVAGAGGSSSRSSDPSPAATAWGGGTTSSSHQLVDGLAHLAAALPARYQARGWSLLYSTSRHGISLQTLYRRCGGTSPSVLLVRDAGGYVFGAFCAEAWRPSARFFGTGETFVFQLAPHKVMFPWQVRSAMKNDFFMYAQQEALAVGGLGAFAIWLDAELLQGSSGSCGTFGSPCLASKEEFRVAAVELWALQ
ncbi:TLD-domain-containing protein [Scenedesmus sp. NREL 46B-D3]|nr:TLD-domain-containing protein [Scenedesmus sp. NREL 46B-D3]